MVIRYITPKDIGHLKALDNRCFSSAVRFNRYELAYYISLPKSLSIADFENEKLLGFMITTEVSFDTVNIVTIDVEPAVRKRGIGKKLLGTMIEILKRFDKTKITLQVSIDNKPAIDFYLKHGFKIVKKLPNYYPTTDGYQMECALV